MSLLVLEPGVVAVSDYAPPLVLVCSACRRGGHDRCEAEVEIDLVARGVFDELGPGAGACACPCDSTSRITVPEQRGR